MEGQLTLRRKTLTVQRAFHSSRLGPENMAAAYELLLPSPQPAAEPTPTWSNDVSLGTLRLSDHVSHAGEDA